MKTIQVKPNPTFLETILAGAEVDPSMSFAVAMALGVFVSGLLATLAVKRNWL